jgi:16S rRNA G527 N7-methylase RsmG
LRRRSDRGGAPSPAALDAERSLLLGFLEAHPRNLLPILDPLLRYRKELLDWSARAALVSRADLPHLFERHVIPALGVPLLEALDGAREILDFGSGAGLPGIPVALAIGAARAPGARGPAVPLRDGPRIALLEAQRKKALFLRRMVEILNLEGTAVYPFRSEELAGDPSMKGRFDRILTRAAGTAMEVWRSTEGLRGSGALLLAIKGNDAVEESREVRDAGLDVRIEPLPGAGEGLSLLVVGAP